jgi:hypothetical protein
VSHCIDRYLIRGRSGKESNYYWELKHAYTQGAGSLTGVPAALSAGGTGMNATPSTNQQPLFRMGSGGGLQREWHAKPKLKPTSRPRPKSGYYGVYQNGESGTWAASICVDSKATHLGCFGTKEEAAATYDAASRKHRYPYTCIAPTGTSVTVLLCAVACHAGGLISTCL